MKVEIQNIRLSVDGDWPVVVHTNDAKGMVDWLRQNCPGAYDIKDFGTRSHIFNWSTMTFTLTDKDLIMFKLTWK